MTESLTDPRASQSFVIVSREQMAALHLLLFELIKASHVHLRGDPLIDRGQASKMHELLAAFEAPNSTPASDAVGQPSADTSGEPTRVPKSPSS
jgi:hypothetical protein